MKMGSNYHQKGSARWGVLGGKEEYTHAVPGELNEYEV